MAWNRLVVVSAAVAFTTVSAPHCLAQVIRGTVIAGDESAPVASVFVELQTLDGGRIESATTGEDGRFQLRVPREGAYRLVASRIGYETLLSDTLIVRPQEIVGVTLRLDVQAVALDALTITQRSQAFHDASYDGLYARRTLAPDIGLWRVWVKGDPIFEASIRPSDLMRWVPPRQWRWTGGRNGSMQQCMPIVFRNGLRDHTGFGTMMLDGSVDDLEGIEIYRDFYSLPLDYRAQLGDVFPSAIRNCLVVAIWLRRPDYPRTPPGSGS